MKKTLLALAVLAAASSVNAAEIYSSENTSVGLKGEIDAYAIQKEVTKVDAKTEVATKTKDSADFSAKGKIQLDASHKLANGLDTFGSFEIESSNTDKTRNAKFDDLYVGVKGEIWGVAVGETGDFAESFDAIQKTDITNEGNYIGLDRPYESSTDGLALKLTPAGGLTLVADVYTNTDDKLDNSYGLSANYATDMFSIGASYNSSEVAEGYDASSYGVSASVDVAGFFFAATYLSVEGLSSLGDVDVEDYGIKSDVGALEGDVWNFAASYQIDALRLYTTYAYGDFDKYVAFNNVAVKESANAKVDDLVVGIDYAVSKNVLLLAEYEVAKGKKDFAGNKYQDITLGVYYKF
ncbi:TPA: porin [Vibrio cholerae]|uniref:porin n=1 Tax=Vibrio cholerae TaxID=666 RepID=UPI002088B2D7|nr:porin [Vibrio cholerae]EJL6558361.1 porin [Vibrio cholerae]ELB7339244.1 porin [Vibrio cholerae]ELC9565045.1 porin [Vibrio cholerae]ELK8280445.1 porin [Vibrio cholerae]